MRILRILAGFFLISLFCHERAWSQEASDYIIRHDGSKVYGTVARDFDFNHTDKINFTDKDQKQLVLGPQDISGFGLANGRFFVSRTLPKSDELVFLQLLLRGKISLYSYNSRYFVDNGKDYAELLSKYDNRRVEGRTVTTFKRPYIGVLSYMMSGPCAPELQQKLARVSSGESGFVNILMLYHNCEGIPFELLIEEIPLFRMSFQGAVGVSSLQASSPGVGRKDVFDGRTIPSVKFGIKLDQIRRMPRISTDLSIAYSRWKTVVNSEHLAENYSLTGTEDFVRSTVSVPLYVNYIFLRSFSNEYYVGGGVTFAFHQLDNGFGITDFKRNGSPSETLLLEDRLMETSSSQAAPSVKLGAHFRFKDKVGFFTELQFEHYGDAYSIHLDHHQADYDQSVLSFLLGVRF